MGYSEKIASCFDSAKTKCNKTSSYHTNDGFIVTQHHFGREIIYRQNWRGIPIVIGSGRWIDREIAIRLAQNGATVVVSNIMFDNTEKIVAKIEADGGKAMVKKPT